MGYLEPWPGKPGPADAASFRIGNSQDLLIKQLENLNLFWLLGLVLVKQFDFLILWWLENREEASYTGRALHKLSVIYLA